MRSELERRWDDAMEEAWTGFRARLADRIAEMEPGTHLSVQLAVDDELIGTAPYCQVMVATNVLHVEAASNHNLDDQYLLTQEEEAELVELGFAMPLERRANFWIGLEQREADRAAWLMVQALRQVYGVMHPIYLEADGLEPGVSRLASLAPQPPASQDDNALRFPQSSDELMEALQEVVGEVLGREAVLDEDGDLPIPTEKTVIFLTVSQQAPRALMFATLVTHVVDEQRAQVEINLLNKAEFGLTFVLIDGAISVRRELPMSVVVPNDVRMEITRLRGDVDRWVSELLVRVGGRGCTQDGPVLQPHDRRSARPEPDDERFRQALRVLRELEREERGSVDPATIARICHGDRDLLLELGRWSTARSNRWGERRRKAEEDGRATFAKVCRAQQRYHRELRSRARQALRSVVQAPGRRERQAPLSLFSEDEASA